MVIWAVSLLSAELSPDVLTAVITQIVFIVCQGWVPLRASFQNRALPLPAKYDASPKAISRRTSYLQVRLAFHLQPQVIRECCNTLRCGPPRSFTCASACPWLGHLVSGLLICTYCRPNSASLSLRLRNNLKLAHINNSLDRSTKSTPSSAEADSDSLYAYSFRFYFTPLSGFFSPFPHGTCSLSIARYI
jgi:hypothetical protein